MLVAEGRGRCVEVLAERGGEMGGGGKGNILVQTALIDRLTDLLNSK